MDVEDEVLLFRTSWGDEEEEEEDGVTHAVEQSCLSRSAGVCGVWRAVGWVYTQPWASGVVLGVAFLMPCILFAYMLLYCPPLDIDLSYSAFEVHSHFSAERFDALTIAVKTQLGSWDRRRRDIDDLEAEALKELLLEKLGEKGVYNWTERKKVKPIFQSDSTLKTEDDQRIEIAEARETRSEPDSSQEGRMRDKSSSSRAEEEQGLWDRNSSFSLIRRRRFAPNYYMQSQALWRIELVFVAQGKGERNIFTPERLETIHHVERLLMQYPQFHQFCWKPMEILRDLPLGPSYCSPPSSLLSYLYPSERAGKIYYDGMGPDLADIQGSLNLAITHPQFYWYVDESLSPEHLSSALLRSEIHFGAPLPSYYSLQDRADEQRARFKNFVVQYAGMLAKQSTSEVKVLYGGTELFDDEVRHTFYNDMMLAVISGACITVLVYILTSFSVFLTFFGLAGIGLSCLMALFLYHVVFGVRYLGILNGVAAFVIIGIGVDDVFVFISTFRQASHLRQPQERMIYTIKTAGRATFLTSFTTAAAYAANTFSQIPAVHDFGLFMALIVSCAWLWVSVLMPAALCIWTQHVEPHEHDWMNCVKLVLGLSASYSPLSDEDDDVALLSVEMEPGSCDTDNDAGILSLTVETPLFHTGQQHMGVVSTKLQWGLKHLVAKPAVWHRKTVLGIFLLVLVFSAGCCCLLRPATHAPLLFRPDTNLQTLMALRSNLSGQGISCPMCSGVFMEKPHLLYTHTSSGLRFSTHQQSQSTTASTVSQSSMKPNPTNTNKTDPMLTVYMSKLVQGGSTTIYRFSLNTSIPSPWKVCSTEHDEVSSFQAFSHPCNNYTSRMTVCVSREYRPYPSWMITSGLCDPRHGWTQEFSFYVAASPQQNSRRLYFAQCHQRPHPSRLCVKTPGCGFSSGPDGPLKGSFYTPLPSDPSSAAKTKASKTSGFNPCSGGACGRPAVRPLVDTGAMVFVVFGILGVNRSENRENHVIGDMGSVVLDPEFDIFKEMGHLCKICKAVGANRKLVKPGGAQCLPSGNKLSSVLPLLHPECHSLPEPNLLPGQLSHGAVGMHGGKVRWLSMAFESTTYKGKSSFQTYSDFLQWENFIQEQLASLPQTSALQRGFQTCEHWKQIFMEIIGVESALWSLLLSLAICVAAVSVFTAHLLLLLPVLITIIGVICLVVAVMYWLGWEMGAVEAISLSILVGSSVDYCLHLVEGYLLAGETVSLMPGQSSEPSAERQRRTLEAVNHVGVAIVSSAVTTAISTVPLFFCVIVPFAKFGQIVAINTAISILFTLSVTSALLACMAPAHFSRHPGAVLKASLAVVAAAVLGGALCWTGQQLGASAWRSLST
ncbi:protein dispatched homolog 3 isoform X1 [Girardinichthys multiradiatus]|uniref:protein dispatched homolog 3 isoform X1 n=1 Tax=Girardinichthys multiradiatus TaxID=208333 RepID=UPI001FAC2A52|nr:protein dispatched homolog 3 isoform X1 [Girardinichthys multiradiatus]XP_047236180.1 protein dispatched homolog 3 isoform X1 [Girardinichthys multiradiatus]XP_047236181.1 protein dispatched homolog 3 isoform X1 [Girardinichthys multiradiatus]